MEYRAIRCTDDQVHEPICTIDVILLVHDQVVVNRLQGWRMDNSDEYNNLFGKNI